MNIFPVYNGNAYFIMLINRADLFNIGYILERFRVLVDEREILTDVKIEYEIGWSEAEKDNIHRIRELLSRAMGAREKFVSESR